MKARFGITSGRWFALVTSLAIGSACGGKAGEPGTPSDAGASNNGGGATSAPERPSNDAVAALIAAVEGKLPTALKGKLSFESVEGEKGRHLALQPKGWEKGVIPGRVKPPSDAAMGFMTSFSTGSNCDGSCEAKDWAKVSESVEFAQFSGGGSAVSKDEKLAAVGDSSGGRLVVAKQADRVDIALARWKEGGSRYFVCRVTLDREAMEAADAFEEACRQMKVLSW